MSLASEFKGTPVKVYSHRVLGATTPTASHRKQMQANGTPTDMVINVGALKSGDYDLVKRDIEAVGRCSW